MKTNNFDLKAKQYKKTRKSVHITHLRPDLHAFAPNLPWHDFSLEGGYIFSHLDGEIAGVYQTNKEKVDIYFQ